MKVEQKEYIEQQTIGEFEEIQSSIRAEDLNFALEAVSANLYSNPIGSFIREIVSNAVDANIDNPDANALVKVRVFKEGNTWYFSVRDYGKGMSKTHFKDVYMAWFNSDKRNSNNKIGGWGLGSKTPLAYREDYELITIVDGIKYSYVIVKQEPVATSSLISEEFTDEPSGTEVVFEVEEKDLYTIYTECTQQLAYFNNVIVEHESYYYNNTFNILESDLFRYRPDVQPFSSMHIIIGQVPYAIDWEILKMKPILMPVGIIFNIGELPVTLSRESINYKHKDIDVIGIIKDKITIILEDLSERYNNQVNFDNIENFVKFMNVDKKYIALGEHKLSIDHNYIKRKPVIILNEHAYQISEKDITTLSNVMTTFHISNYKVKEVHYNSLTRIFNTPPSNSVLKDVDINHWSNKYFNEKDLISLHKPTQLRILRFAESLGFGTFTNNHYFKGRRFRYYKNNSFKSTLNLYVAVQKELKNKLKKYSDVPQSYIDAEKASQKEAEEARKGKITVYNPVGNIVGNQEVDYLYNNYDYVFYLNRKDNMEKIAHYVALFDTLPKYYKEKLKLIIVTPTSIKSIKRLDKFKPIEKILFFKNLRNHFNRVMIGEQVRNLDIMYKHFAHISKYHSDKYISIFNEYVEKLNIQNSYLVYNIEEKEVDSIDINFLNYFKDQFQKLKNDKSYKYVEHLPELQKVRDYIITASLIFQHSFSSQKRDNMKYIVNKSKLLRINRNF